jgi:protein tyrosine phosphatase (PTP) superfamily phosphohydrolase (DUF442 family)
MHERLLQTIMLVERKSKEEAIRIRDELIDVAGAGLGYIELLGLRYPVTSYHQLVSSVLTRGSRLDVKEVAGLPARGFRGLVNLCAESDAERAPAELVGLHYLYIPIIDNTPPTEDQVHLFLDFVEDEENDPVYCHCAAGVGRTGVMVACYRMVEEGWPPERAIDEAKSFGMAMPDQLEFLKKFGARLSG